jgi:hypothetical protein
MNEVIKGALATSYWHLEYLVMCSINTYFFPLYIQGIEECLGHSCFSLMTYWPIPSLTKNTSVILVLFLKLFERISTMLNWRKVFSSFLEWPFQIKWLISMALQCKSKECRIVVEWQGHSSVIELYNFHDLVSYHRCFHVGFL